MVCLPVNECIERATALIIAEILGEMYEIRSSIRKGLQDLDRVQAIEKGAQKLNVSRISTS